jgi:ECF transporter S component (folate family)
MKISTRNLVIMSLFIAMKVAMRSYFTIDLAPTIRFGFSWVPVALCSIMVGPLLGALAAGIADILATLIHPPATGFFIGFTFSAICSGFIYGAVLYKKPKTIFRILLASILVSLIVNMGLNTLWITILQGKAFLVILPLRAVKDLIEVPIKLVVLLSLCKALSSVIDSDSRVLPKNFL